MTYRILLSLSCAALTGLSGTTAAHAGGLTKQTIQEFLDQTTALTHEDTGMSDEAVTDFLNTHLSPSGAYASNVTFSFPGFPPQTKALSLNKETFIDNVLQGRQAMRNYSSSVSLTDTKIKKTTADIQTVTIESGYAPMPDGSYAAFEGKSTCDQTLELESNDTIILVSALCETTLTYQAE